MARVWRPPQRGRGTAGRLSRLVCVMVVVAATVAVSQAFRATQQAWAEAAFVAPFTQKVGTRRTSTLVARAQGDGDPATIKALKESLEEIKNRATKAEQDRLGLATKLERMESSVASAKKDKDAMAQQSRDMAQQVKEAEKAKGDADARAESFREVLNNITAIVSAAVNEPGSDPIKLLDEAVKDAAASEEKVAQTLKEKEEVLMQVEALELRLAELDKLRDQLATAQAKAKILSDGVEQIAGKLGVSGGFFGLFSSPTDEKKVEAILAKIETMKGK